MFKPESDNDGETRQLVVATGHFWMVSWWIYVPYM